MIHSGGLFLDVLQFGQCGAFDRAECIGLGHLEAEERAKLHKCWYWISLQRFVPHDMDREVLLSGPTPVVLVPSSIAELDPGWIGAVFDESMCVTERFDSRPGESCIVGSTQHDVSGIADDEQAWSTEACEGVMWPRAWWVFMKRRSPIRSPVGWLLTTRRIVSMTVWVVQPSFSICCK